MKLRTLVFALMSTLSANAAQAGPGCLYQDAFLFSDPTYLGGLIGTIPAPTPVEVVRKGRKWSIISYNGESGYVATRHLSPGSRTRPDPPPLDYDQTLTLRQPLAFWSGPNYFWGYNRSYWTSRRNWSRESYLSPDDPAWAACGVTTSRRKR